MKTYLYLRLAIVLSVILLALAVTGEITRGVGWLGSISAYYYTPVRNVFAGVLVGTGFALVAIKGRPGAEDTFLNLAGMLAPIVAFVPTPLTKSDSNPCAVPLEKCVPDVFLPDIANNVHALLAVGAVGLGVAFFTARSDSRSDSWTQNGLIASVAIWVAFLLWYGFGEDWPPRGSFLQVAHYWAAVPMFLLIIAVAVINARRSNPKHTLSVAGRSSNFRPIYGWIAALMLALPVTLTIAGWAARRAGFEFAWIFAVEAVVLVLFAVFWLVQGVEYRKDGLDEDALVLESEREGA